MNGYLFYLNFILYVAIKWLKLSWLRSACHMTIYSIILMSFLCSFSYIQIELFVFNRDQWKGTRKTWGGRKVNPFTMRYVPHVPWVWYMAMPFCLEQRNPLEKKLKRLWSSCAQHLEKIMNIKVLNSFQEEKFSYICF